MYGREGRAVVNGSGSYLGLCPGPIFLSGSLTGWNVLRQLKPLVSSVQIQYVVFCTDTIFWRCQDSLFQHFRSSWKSRLDWQRRQQPFFKSQKMKWWWVQPPSQEWNHGETLYGTWERALECSSELQQEIAFGSPISRGVAWQLVYSLFCGGFLPTTFLAKDVLSHLNGITGTCRKCLRKLV